MKHIFKAIIGAAALSLVGCGGGGGGGIAITEPVLSDYTDLGPWADEGASGTVASSQAGASSIGMLPLSGIKDGTYTFHGSARGQVRSADINGPMTADMTLRFYHFTRGPSAGTNVIDGSFENIVVDGDAWWSPVHSFTGGAVGDGGEFDSGGVSGQLYGPSASDKVAPMKADGSFDIQLHTRGGVGQPTATGAWSASR